MTMPCGKCPPNKRVKNASCGTQRLDYELLCVAADFQGFEGCHGHLSDGRHIGFPLISD